MKRGLRRAGKNERKEKTKVKEEVKVSEGKEWK